MRIVSLSAIAILSSCGPVVTAGDGSLDGGDVPVPDSGVTCANALLAPPPEGVCSVIPGSAATLLRGDVLSPQGVLQNGMVLIAADGRISCAACDCSTHPAFVGATVVACARGVISPGLINAHDHLTFDGNKPVPHGTERYDHRNEWRKGLGGHTKLTAPQTSATPVVQWSELRQVLAGTTSIFGSGGAARLARNLDSATRNEGLGAVVADYDTFPLGDSAGAMLSSSCGYPSLPNVSVVQAEPAYVPHVAEGVNAAARNEYLCLAGQQGGGVNVCLGRSAFIHAIALTAQDAAHMAADGAGVVWSPRSNVSLYGHTAAVTTYDRLGLRIALGSDWTPSGSVNMLRELACADSLNRTLYASHFSDEALWRMATVNGARVLGVQGLLGTLEPGAWADIAVFDGTTRSGHRAVIGAGVGDVALVLRAGKVLHGDAAVVAALAPDGLTGCEPIEVCGVRKRVCLPRELGTTLAALSASNASSYGLFFCGEPPDEPTCVPSRAGQYTGIAAPGDADGDGVPDAQDDCPSVFNPPRPLDQGMQLDTDGDGLGDACDWCPLDATNQCAP